MIVPGARMIAMSEIQGENLSVVGVCYPFDAIVMPQLAHFRLVSDCSPVNRYGFVIDILRKQAKIFARIDLIAVIQNRGRLFGLFVADCMPLPHQRNVQPSFSDSLNQDFLFQPKPIIANFSNNARPIVVFTLIGINFFRTTNQLYFVFFSPRIVNIQPCRVA